MSIQRKGFQGSKRHVGGVGEPPRQHNVDANVWRRACISPMWFGGCMAGQTQRVTAQT